MKEELIKKAYEIAVERYAAVGVDANKALEDLQKISLSLHCWQADDVTGFVTVVSTGFVVVVSVVVKIVVVTVVV